MNLATATPREIDTKLAQLHNDIAEAKGRLGQALGTVHEYVGDRKRGRTTYKLSHADAIAEAKDRLVDAKREAETTGKALFYYHGDAGKALARVAELYDTLTTLEAECDIIDTEYCSRPWSRFIAVRDGHLHSGTRCEGGTIRATTQLGWHPELSGKTEAEAVAELGPLLCTKCFPTAPVEWTVGMAAKKVADGYCEGQGEQGENLQMQYVSPRGNCPKCKQSTGISKTGKVLKHKLKEG